MTAFPLTFPLLCAALIAAGPSPDAPAWGEFRGPNGAGVRTDCAAPVEVDPAAPTWAVAAPAGQSSPVLLGDSVVLTGIEQERFVVRAYGRSDRAERWTYRGPDVPLEPVHASGSPAASTPCTDGDRLYVDFGSFGVLCLDADGRELWRRPLPVPESLYGTSASPVVHGGRVFVLRDDDADLPGSPLSRSRLSALDANTGETVWEAPRPTHRSGWSTPTVWERDGRTELVVLGSGRLRGYAAADGRELWNVGGFSRETIARPLVVRLAGGGTRAVASAAMLGGVADDSPDPEPFWAAVIAFDADGDGRLRRAEMTGDFTFPFRPDLPPGHPGFGMPLPRNPAKRAAALDRMHAGIDGDGDGVWTRDEFLARLNFDRGGPQLVSVRPGGTGDVSDSHLDWTVRRGVAEIPTPLALDGLLYQIADGGVLTTVNLADGAVVGRRRVGAGGHLRASPVAAVGPGGAAHLFLLSQAGALTVLKAGRAPEVVHRATFAGPVAATPALDAETLYVRTADRLLAFRGSPPAPRPSDEDRPMTTTKDHDERVAKMTFASVLPHYLARIERNGRTEEELRQVIEWLTGYDEADLDRLIGEKTTFERFFAEADLNPHAHLITGKICGYRIEEIRTPLTRQARYLDKLVDELARGRKMEKILRRPAGTDAGSAKPTDRRPGNR